MDFPLKLSYANVENSCTFNLLRQGYWTVKFGDNYQQSKIENLMDFSFLIYNS